MGDDYQQQYKIADNELDASGGITRRAAILGAIAAPLMGSTSTEAQTDPAGYVSGMIALGWAPCVLVHDDGRRELFERYPDGPDADAIIRGHALSAFWMETGERRSAVIRALIERDLIIHA